MQNYPFRQCNSQIQILIILEHVARDSEVQSTSSDNGWPPSTAMDNCPDLPLAYQSLLLTGRGLQVLNSCLLSHRRPLPFSNGLRGQ